MTVERKQKVVLLYNGSHETELTDLLEQAMSAQADEEAEPERFGTKSKAIEIAKKYDALLAVAGQDATRVTLWQVSYLEWGPLSDLHPPREGDAQDRQHGLNRRTFPKDLLKISLVEPGESKDLDTLLTEGEKALSSLGALSQPQYVRLESAAWSLSTGDDQIPKASLVSLLKQRKDLDSKPQQDSA